MTDTVLFILGMAGAIIIFDFCEYYYRIYLEPIYRWYVRKEVLVERFDGNQFPDSLITYTYRKRTLEDKKIKFGKI